MTGIDVTDLRGTNKFHKGVNKDNNNEDWPFDAFIWTTFCCGQEQTNLSLLWEGSSAMTVWPYEILPSSAHVDQDHCFGQNFLLCSRGCSDTGPKRFVRARVKFDVWAEHTLLTRNPRSHSEIFSHLICFSPSDSANVGCESFMTKSEIGFVSTDSCRQYIPHWKLHTCRGLHLLQLSVQRCRVAYTMQSSLFLWYGTLLFNAKLPASVNGQVQPNRSQN